MVFDIINKYVNCKMKMNLIMIDVFQINGNMFFYSQSFGLNKFIKKHYKCKEYT
jgi:hypothetical protein